MHIALVHQYADPIITFACVRALKFRSDLKKHTPTRQTKASKYTFFPILNTMKRSNGQKKVVRVMDEQKEWSFYPIIRDTF